MQPQVDRHAAPKRSLTLVVLAAGAGRRFGGLKQFDAVGGGGEPLMDFAVYDAAGAGFGRAVFVIREDMESAFARDFVPRYAGRLDVSYVLQRMDLPGGRTPSPARTRPWGTGHAVLSAAPRVGGPFAVVNADDFYGRAAFQSLAAFLSGASIAAPVPIFAMVGYRLRDTLTASGAVSRGVCRCAEPGWLDRIEEVHGLIPAGEEARAVQSGTAPAAASGEERISGETIVSMNCWGFTPALFGELEAAFARFLSERSAPEREFYLPAVVNDLLRRGAARVRVLGGGDAWCGLTHVADRERVREHVAELVRRGEYPRELWS